MSGCERLVPPYTNNSYRALLNARIALCERLASPYASSSHRSMRAVRSALCERFASFYASVFADQKHFVQADVYLFYRKDRGDFVNQRE